MPACSSFRPSSVAMHTGLGIAFALHESLCMLRECCCPLARIAAAASMQQFVLELVVCLVAPNGTRPRVQQLSALFS